jgi:hypothetical protein
MSTEKKVQVEAKPPANDLVVVITRPPTNDVDLPPPPRIFRVPADTTFSDDTPTLPFEIPACKRDLWKSEFWDLMFARQSIKKTIFAAASMQRAGTFDPVQDGTVRSICFHHMIKDMEEQGLGIKEWPLDVKQPPIMMTEMVYLDKSPFTRIAIHL